MYTDNQMQTKSVTQTISSPASKPRHRNLMDSLMKKIIKDKNAQLTKNGSVSSPIEQLPLVRIPTVKSDYMQKQPDRNFVNLSSAMPLTMTPFTQCDSEPSRKSSGHIETFDHFETGPQESHSESDENESALKSDAPSCTDLV